MIAPIPLLGRRSIARAEPDAERYAIACARIKAAKGPLFTARANAVQAKIEGM